MNYFLMIVCVVTCTIQSPFKKIYQNETNKGTFLFNALIQIAAACFFAVTCLFQGGFAYEWGALPYSLGFALALSCCSFTSVAALRYGSLALTALISSYSLMIPTFYGFVRFKDPVYVTQLVGIVFLLVSLYMTNMAKKEAPSADAPAKCLDSEGVPKKEKSDFFKWLILVVIMAVANGACTIVQKEQQVRFDGNYKGSFMLVALFVSFLSFLVIGLIRERHDIKTVLQKGAAPAVLTGLANGATNLLVMIVTATIAASIFFPVISGGGMVLSYVISVTVFKEKFTTMQKIGILFGVISLVFLNLPLGNLGSL